MASARKETAEPPILPAPKSSRSIPAILLRLLVVGVLVIIAGGGIWLLYRVAQPEAARTTTDIPAIQVEPGSALPVVATVTDGVSDSGSASKNTQPQTPDLFNRWAEQTAAATGVPARALLAYGRAEVVLRSVSPACRISWATLAGIARIESDHGRYGGAELTASGRPSKLIIGVPLDGAPGVKAIPDTDGGRLDGDPVHDRAVGPMQFIPSTWAAYNSDGNGDGVGDPQQIDDAALAAARYLCAGARNMGSPQGWWAGIQSYNNSVIYAQKVFGLADGYARAAQSVKIQG